VDDVPGGGASGGSAADAADEDATSDEDEPDRELTKEEKRAQSKAEKEARKRAKEEGKRQKKGEKMARKAAAARVVEQQDQAEQQQALALDQASDYESDTTDKQAPAARQVVLKKYRVLVKCSVRDTKDVTSMKVGSLAKGSILLVDAAEEHDSVVRIATETGSGHAGGWVKKQSSKGKKFIEQVADTPAEGAVPAQVRPEPAEVAATVMLDARLPTELPVGVYATSNDFAAKAEPGVRSFQREPEPEFNYWTPPTYSRNPAGGSKSGSVRSADAAGPATHTVSRLQPSLLAAAPDEPAARSR
jgi:hypothetical protein